MSITATAATATTAAAATAAVMVAGARLAGAVSPMPTSNVAAVMSSPQWLAAGSDGEAEELVKQGEHDNEPEGTSGTGAKERNLGDMHAGKGADRGKAAPTFVRPYLREEDTQLSESVDAAKTKMKEALQSLGLTNTERGNQLMKTIAKQIQELAMSERAGAKQSGVSAMDSAARGKERHDREDYGYRRYSDRPQEEERNAEADMWTLPARGLDPRAVGVSSQQAAWSHTGKPTIMTEQAMTPITTANTIHALKEDLEKQREVTANNLKISAHEANYTYQAIDRQSHDIKMLQNSLTQIQEQMSKMSVPTPTQPKYETYAMETPVAKLQFTPHYTTLYYIQTFQTIHASITYMHALHYVTKYDITSR